MKKIILSLAAVVSVLACNERNEVITELNEEQKVNSRVTNENASLEKFSLDSRYAVFNGVNYSIEQIEIERSKLRDADILEKLHSSFGINDVRTISADSELSELIGVNIGELVSEYTFENSTYKFYISNNDDNKNRFDFYKVDLNDDNIPTLLNSITFEVENNELITIKDFDTQDVIYSTDRRLWCQQEKVDKGSSSACQDREYDEFTSDWVGFVAYWSNPQIAILIAAMCRC